MYLFQDDLASEGGYISATLAGARTASDALSLPLFTREEELVLHLARRDGLRSVDEPGRFGKAWDRLFAIKRPLPLASTRLEALRRAAVLLRVKRRLPESELELLHASGFSGPQLTLLEALVGPSRGNVGRWLSGQR